MEKLFNYKIVRYSSLQKSYVIQHKKVVKKIWIVIEKGSIFAALSQNGEATRPPLEREVH